MPILVTKTFRITEHQENTLLLPKFKGRSSFLIRELIRIGLESNAPGIEILRLREKLEKGELR